MLNLEKSCSELTYKPTVSVSLASPLLPNGAETHNVPLKNSIPQSNVQKLVGCPRVSEFKVPLVPIINDSIVIVTIPVILHSNKFSLYGSKTVQTKLVEYSNKYRDICS